MPRLVDVSPARKAHQTRAISELGRKLRKLSEKIASSGEKPLTRRELQREIARRRGGVRPS